MRFLSNILAKAGLVVDGTTQLNTIANATVDTDRFLVSDSAIVKYRTGAQVLSDIGAAPAAAGLPVGGTAGQILAKIDATNYNTQWIDNYAPQIQHIVKLGAAMSAGTPVYVSSADGTNMIVSKASNDSEATSTKVLGLIKTGGVLNDQVFVVTEGLLAGIDTSTAQAGDPVWLGVNGAILFGVANKPVAPAHMVFLGVVTRVQANNGEIFVKIQNGYELDELHDVSLPSYVSNGVLYRDTAVNLWKTASIATVLGYTPANDSLVVHIAGAETITGAKTFSSALTLSTIANATTDTDRFLVSDSGVVKYRTGAEVLSDIGAQPLLTNPVTGTGNTNYIPKFTSSSAIGNSAIYDNGGNIGIGTTSPAAKLHIYGAFPELRLEGNNDVSGSGFISFYRPTSGIDGYIQSGGSGLSIDATTNLLFRTGGSERMRLDASGNLGLGTSSPATKLDVNGGAIIRGSYSGFSGGELLLNAGANQQVAISTNGTGTTEMYFDHRGTNTGIWVWRGSSSTKMTLNASGNLGLGVTPSVWSIGKALEINSAGNGIWSYSNDNVYINQNAYFNGGWKYGNSATAAQYIQFQGQHFWLNAPYGTAGSAISFTQAMTLDASGRLGIGTTSPNDLLHINGSGIVKMQIQGSTESQLRLNSGYGQISNVSGDLYFTIESATGSQIFRTGSSTERMRITSGGAVGIGTSSPTQKLNIASDGYNFRIANSTNFQGYNIGRNVSDGLLYFYGDESNYVGYVFTGVNGERMRITSGGNVGIGSSSPTGIGTGYTSVDIQGTNGGGIVFGPSGTKSIVYGGSTLYLDANTTLSMYTSGSEKARLTSTGELLINTTSDAGDYKLQVNGNSYVNGDMSFGGSQSLRWGSNTYIYGSNNTQIEARVNGNLGWIINSSGNTEFGGSIKTAAPSGGTARTWKFGSVVASSVTYDQNNYVEVEINGTAYQLALATPS